MAEHSFSSLAEFAAHISTLTVATEHNQEEALHRAAEVVREGARHAIGSYEFGWPALAESTKRDRVAKGFSADEPLFRTGELWGSLRIKVEMSGFIGSWNQAWVGSDLDRAVWHEMGTSRAPPRPFLMGSAVHHEKEIVDILGKGAVKGIVQRL